MAHFLDALGHKDSIGVCLDTGNSWLAGSEPVAYIRRFGRRIKHVHWKDLGPEWLTKRGTVYGCGMSSLALGDGLIGIAHVVGALRDLDFEGFTTLEVMGRENVLLSRQRLCEWWDAAANATESNHGERRFV